MLDKYTGSYEGTVILDDFNMQPTNQILGTYLKANSFVNLIKFNTCYKSKPGSYIDLILKAISNKQFEANSFLQDVEQSTEKRKLYRIEKRLCEKVKQTRSLQNESDSSKS